MDSSSSHSPDLFQDSLSCATEGRLRAEEALRQSEELHRTILRSALDGYWLVNQKGRIVEVNEAYCRLSGYSESELVGMPIAKLEAIEQSQEVEERMRAIVMQGSMRFETRHRRKDGTDFEVEVSVQYNPEIPHHLVAFFRDISERRTAEEDRERLRGLLEQAQRMESVGRLAGGVAHDFNNMLCVIIGRAEEALSELQSGGLVGPHLEEILKAGERSADLTRQLLAFARQQTAMPRALRLDSALDSILRILQRLIGENIDLRWHPGAEDCVVRIDPSQLDQILANLCVNARDAIGDSGRIVIETMRATLPPDPDRLSGMPPGSYAVLTVSDNGEGMDEATTRRIFEPFFTTKEVGRGTGLGLATVYGIVHQNDGHITVESAPGRGTTFRIHFPLVPEETPPDDSSSCPLIPRGEDAILLVEDEPLVLEMTEDMLRARGYEVLTASTPEEALVHLDAHGDSIRLLLTDVVMPGMNGRELAQRAKEQAPGIRVLFMSGYTSHIVTQQEILPDGTRFLQKPFSMEALFTKVRESLTESPPPPPYTGHEPSEGVDFLSL